MNEKGRATVREPVIHRSVNCDLVHLHQNTGTLTRQDAVVKKLLKQVMTLSFQRILRLDCCCFFCQEIGLHHCGTRKRKQEQKSVGNGAVHSISRGSITSVIKKENKVNT